MGMTHEQMIERAWARAQALQLTVYRARVDYDGTVFIPVQSQREGHPEHRVYIVRGTPQCDCEAMAYGRVPVCVHILTVCLRAMRAKKRGTRGLARMIAGIYNVTLDMTV